MSNQSDVEDDIWRDVYGHNAAKQLIGAALRSGTTHILIVGPPGSGKSVVLETIDGNVPGVVYRDGKNLKAGDIRDVLRDDPPIVIIDEIDSMHHTAYDVLSLPMEQNVLSVGGETFEVDTQFLAACNHPQKLPDHIRNRFREVTFQRYSTEEYLKLCAHMLPRRVAWVETESQARSVGQIVLDETGEPDPRTARDIALMGQSVDEVRSLIRAMDDPDADVDVSPLRVSDIARVQDEVGKMKIQSELVREIVNRGSESDETVVSSEVEDEVEQAVDDAVGSDQR